MRSGRDVKRVKLRISFYLPQVVVVVVPFSRFISCGEMGVLNLRFVCKSESVVIK